MGVVANIINKVVDRAGNVAEQAVLDKDALVQVKLELEKIRAEEMESARSIYETELKMIQGKGINFLRAFPRPFWAILTSLIFGFSSFTYIYSWWLKAMRGIDIQPITLPWMLFAIIGQVVTFYFGARFFEKKAGSSGGTSFIEKLGDNL